MEVDVFYKTKNEEIYKHVRRNVADGSVPLAIYSATDNLYINKKNMWALLQSVRCDGALAVQTPLWNLGTVVAAAQSICNENNRFDIVLFTSDEIPGMTYQCFYEACIPFVLVYREHRPLAWSLPDPTNIYGKHSNIIPCSFDVDEGRQTLIPELSREMIAKLLEITDFQDVILLAGSKALYYARNIKNMCRHVIAFGEDQFSGINNECIRTEEV